MRRRAAHFLLVVLALSCFFLLSFGNNASAGETSLLFNSEPRDYIGGGKISLYTPAYGAFTAQRNYKNGVSVSFNGPGNWHLDFAEPGSQPLTVGLYAGAISFWFQSSSRPGLNVEGDGKACDTVAGSFEVKEITYGPSNSVTAFWATFEQHCDGNWPGLAGEIRFNADVIINIAVPPEKLVQRGQTLTFTVSATDINRNLMSLTATGLPAGATFGDNGANLGTFNWTPAPNQKGTFIITFHADNGQGTIVTASTIINVLGEMSLTLYSEPGDPLGGGQQYFFTPSDGSFYVGRNNDDGISILFGTPSLSHWWSLAFAPPNGPPLAVGTYTGTSGFPWSTRRSLNISGDGTACDTTTGIFQVKEITYGFSNLDTSFWATFEQHCDGAVPPLYGDIRFNAALVVALTVPHEKLIAQNSELAFTVSATEINGDIVTLTAAGLPPGATFTDNHNNTGTFTWVPGLNQSGVFTVNFHGDNRHGGIDTVSTIINILAPLTILTSGNGTVTSTGINCPGDCAESYANGSTIMLTANSASGYKVGQWVGCDTVNGNQCMVQMRDARMVSVSFTQITYPLIISPAPVNGTVTASGINCPEDCAESYVNGTTVTLTANPVSGYQTDHWTGCDSANGSQCLVQMTSFRNVSVTFGLVPSVASQSYLPLYSGNFWRYQVNGSCCFTTTVLPGTTSINGVETKALQDTDGLTQYFTNDGNGIRLHRQFDPASGIMVTYSPPMMLAPASMSIGQTANSSGTAQTNVGNFGYSASYTIQSVDNVTVPLRSFNVLRLQGTVTIAGGGSVSSTVYPARSVGLVKEIDNNGSTIDTIELVATNLHGIADFDGDGKADIAIYRSGAWSILRSSDGGNTVMGWGGAPQDRPIMADYDGDGKLDVAIYRGGAWSILQSGENLGVFSQPVVVGWGGAPQDIPVPADYDGDGKADIAIYRDGAWSILRSSDGGNTVVGWGGAPQDILVPADYDGDGKTDIAIYRDGTWSILRSSDGGNTIVGWGGGAQDIPVPADYDGDGKADVAIYRNGVWSIKRSSDGGNTVVAWGGGLQDIPVPADYDGDGKTDIAIYRNGTWIIKRSSDGGTTVVDWGGAVQDIPLSFDAGAIRIEVK